MAARTIDQEVVQRLAKGSDLAVLTGIALFLTLQSAHSSQQVSAAGFFALCIGLASLRIVRGFGLYGVSAWISGVSTAIKSFSITVIIGWLALLSAPIFGLSLNEKWAISFMVLTAAYFSLSRLFTHLWSEPLAKAGKLKQRIAIVGGGKAAEAAINLIELSPISTPR